MTALTTGAEAQSAASDRTTIIWVNSWYGPNTSGAGLAARSGGFGLGATMFGFAGDTTTGLPTRHGATGISVDLYLLGDFTTWLSVYGNIGVVSRLGSYRGSGSVTPMFHNSAAMSAGCGFQISIASHVMVGFGYNGAIDFHDETIAPRYPTINALVAQVGYRL